MEAGRNVGSEGGMVEGRDGGGRDGGGMGGWWVE